MTYPYNKLWNIFICWGQCLWISKISLVFHSRIFRTLKYKDPLPPSKVPINNNDALENEQISTMQGDYPQRKIRMFIPALSSSTTMMGVETLGEELMTPAPFLALRDR